MPFRRILGYLGSHGMGRSLRHRDFALFLWLGWFSNLGFWVQRVGLQWLVWELTGSGTWLGIIALAEAVPAILLAPIAGAVADRMDRLKLAKLAQAGAVTVAATLAVLVITDVIRLDVLVVIMLVSGANIAFWSAARHAIMPNLVPREDFASAVGLSSALFNLAQFIGPAAAGVIIAFFGVGWTFAVNGASYLCFMVALFNISLLRQEHRSAAPDGLFRSMGEGLAFVARHRGIGPALLLLFLTALCMKPYLELLAGFADGVFGRGVEGLATLASAYGFGALLSATIVANFSRPRTLAGLLFAALLLAAAVQMVMSLTSHFWVAILCSALLGGCLSAAFISVQVLIQGAVPGEMRGRVMSFWNVINRGGPGAGALIVGGLSETWGFQPPLFGAAVVFLVIWAVYMRWRRALTAHLMPA